MVAALSVAVGTLGVAIAVLAIGATVILFRQSQEHRALIKSLVDPFIEDAKQRLDVVIADTKKQVQAAVEPDKKKQLEKHLANLARARKDLDNRALAVRVGERFGASLGGVYTAPFTAATPFMAARRMQQMVQEGSETLPAQAPDTEPRKE